MGNKQFFITQGDVLMLLIKKDGRRIPEIAKVMDYHPKTLPGYYQDERLPETVIQKACDVFGVDRSVFEVGSLIADLTKLKEQNAIRDARSENRQAQFDALLMKVEAMEREIRALREENLILQKPKSN